MLEQLFNNRFLRFLFVGGTATLLQMLILVLLVEQFGLYPVVGSTLGYGIAALYNYLMNYHLTFASDKSHLETFPKFLVVVCVGMTSNALCMALFVAVGLHYLLAQVGAILVTLVINFLLHKFWIYRS